MSESVEIPDAAVVAAAKAVSLDWRNYIDSMRIALVAARPYLMPTREQIAAAAHKHFCVMPGEPTHEPDEIDYDKADEVIEILALLNGEIPEDSR